MEVTLVPGLLHGVKKKTFHKTGCGSLTHHFEVSEQLSAVRLMSTRHGLLLMRMPTSECCLRTMKESTKPRHI